MSSADRALKRLAIYLGRKMTRVQLDRIGLDTLLNFDRPTTTDSVEMACEALLYLSQNSEGDWDQILTIVLGVLAVLKEMTGAFPPDWDLEALRDTLETHPLDSEAVRRWFQRVYR